jgi:hypothetical protein
MSRVIRDVQESDKAKWLLPQCWRFLPNDRKSRHPVLLCLVNLTGHLVRRDLTWEPRCLEISVNIRNSASSYLLDSRMYDPDGDEQKDWEYGNWEIVKRSFGSSLHVPAIGTPAHRFSWLHRSKQSRTDEHNRSRLLGDTYQESIKNIRELRKWGRYWWEEPWEQIWFHYAD